MAWLFPVFRMPIASRFAATAAAAALAVGLAVPGSASGQPRPTVATVERQVAVLTQQEVAARAKYAAMVPAVRTSEARAAAAAAAVATGEAKLSRVRAAMSEMAASNYRTGGANALLRLLLAEDPDTLLRSADWVEQSAEYQADALRRVVAVQQALDRDRLLAQQEVARLTRARAEAGAQQRVIAQKAIKVRTLLGALHAEARKRLQEARRRAIPGATVAAASPPAAPVAAAQRRTLRSRPASIGGSCARSGSRGAEGRLTGATMRLMRCGLGTFPQIHFAGGWGARGNATDHDDGRAVDFMIPNYASAAGNDFGWAVAAWAARQPNVSYVIFDQMQYGTWNGGWQKMSNRGSDTANHRDHVHVSMAS